MKIIWMFLFTITSIFASEYYAKLEPIDSFQVKAAVSGKVIYSNSQIEGSKANNSTIIEIDSEDTKCIIPGKLFEYMVSERPILAIGPKNSDFENIIKQTNTGVFYQYNEKIELKNQISTYFNQYLDKNLKVHAVGLQQFSRKNLTEKLAKLLNERAK